MHHLLEALVELVAPTRCAGCELPGELFCSECERLSASIEASYRCPRCGAPFGWLVCTECWATEFAFEAAVALGELSGPLARAVVLNKDSGERRLGGVLGGLLGSSVAACWPRWADAVTWVPSTDSAIRRRGFDHAMQLSIPVAEHLSAPAFPLLRRRNARDQRELGRRERAANSIGTFEASASCEGSVLLVDDVMTTGATLDAAARALLEAGAGSVRVAVLARAW